MLFKIDQPFLRHLPIFCLLGIFILYKIPYLTLPYFWDAAWVYAPAIHEMAINGPSLLATSLDPSLSRGHPLMLHFIVSTVMQLFGSSPLVLHMTMLVISMATLVVLYQLGCQLKSNSLGFFAVCLFIGQEMFVAQSLMVLPEMLLTFFILLALLQYLRGKLFLYAMAATGALLTKETALVLILSILAVHTVLNWRISKRDQLQKISSQYVILALPIFLGSLHFFYQKWCYGWFFYPHHLEFFKESWQSFYYDVRYIIDWIFYLNGNGIATMTAALALLWSGKNHWKIIIGLLLVSYFGFITFHRDWPSPDFSIKLLCLAILIFVWSVVGRRLVSGQKNSIFILFSLVYSVSIIAFSAYNVFTVRYLLHFLAIYTLLISWCVHKVQMNPIAYYLLGIAFLVFQWSVTFEKPLESIKDVDLNYIEGVEVTQQLVDSAYSLQLREQYIHASLLEKIALQESQAGYLQGRQPFTHVDLQITTETQYALFVNMALEPTYETITEQGFERITRIKIGDAWGEIWKRSP